MKVISTVAEMAARRERVTRPLGLVPTMGFLHEGHLSLVRRAREQSATAVVSIFVNPTQFGPHEDLAAYPRDLERDLELLEREGVDLVFNPLVEEIYPQEFDTAVDPGEIARRLEGAARPGHLRGVATVVTKLFTIVRPDFAYFGQKDGQQARVIQRVTSDLNLGVEVVICPTVREADGLAMSSRNAYLNAEERKAAPVLYRALCHAQELYRDGVGDAASVRQAMQRLLDEEPLVRPDYVSIADSETLEELERLDRPAMVSLAVRIGKARLIDNVVIPEAKD